MLLLLILLTPFVGALLCLLTANRGLPKQTPWLITMLTTAVTFGLLILATVGWAANEPPRFFVPWVPEIGLNFSLWLDGPALFFTWLVVGLGLLIFFYAGFYMDPEDSPWRFFGTMLFFMGAMLGVVMSKNVLLMFVFWELTSVSSFILIGHWHYRESARSGALRALVITGSGGLALLIGIGGMFWMMLQVGVPASQGLEWDVLWANASALTVGALALPVMVLALLGAFTKSAQFPFHFWLPGAMEAPTPVSAFLHAATMVKAGIYLLGRLYPIYSDETVWLALVGTVGVTTMVIGGFMAVTAYDLKQLLAHSTVSQLGLLTAYYGFGHRMIGTESPLPVDLLLVASHAFFKGALFMLVGVIDHSVHTRDWRKMGGLRKSMPITCALVIIGCVSMAGLPFTLGFIAKELFLKMSMRLNTDILILAWGLPILAVFASLFTMAYSLRCSVTPFFGKPRDPHLHPHEGGWGLLISPAILIGLTLAGGLYTAIITTPIGALVNAAYFNTVTGFKLPVAFFEHVDIVTISAVGIAVFGTLLFLQLDRIEKAYVALKSPTVFLTAYETFFNGWVPRFASGLTGLVHQQSLSKQLTVTTGVFFGALLLAILFYFPSVPAFPSFEKQSFVMLGLIIGIIPCLQMALTHPVLLYRVIALAPLGLFLAMVFVLFNAPDLALTLLFVEVVTAMVLLMLLYKIPQRSFPQVSLGAKWLRVGIAVTAGLILGFLSYTATSSPLREQSTFPGWPHTAQFYIENTKFPPFETREEAIAAGYPGAEAFRSGGGTNAVNVVLVDFRAFDTLGEIIVLGIAAIGVYCLLMVNMGRRREDSRRVKIKEAVDRIRSEPLTGKPIDKPIIKQETWVSPSLLVSEVSRVAPALLAVFTVVLFYVGHNYPGGGFIAGLAFSIALVMFYIGFPAEKTQKLRNQPWLNLLPIGIFIGVGTGLVSLAFGYPFLTTWFDFFTLPIVGEFELASALAFDLGVFLLVVGTTLIIIEHFRRV